MQYVSNGRARWRSDNPYTAREDWQRPLQFFIKQSFSSKPLAQLLERNAQSARAYGVKPLYHQFVIAARLVNRQTTARANLKTIRGLEAYGAISSAKATGAKLRELVLDCEIPVAGSSNLEV